MFCSFTNCHVAWRLPCNGSRHPGSSSNCPLHLQTSLRESPVLRPLSFFDINRNAELKHALGYSLRDPWRFGARASVSDARARTNEQDNSASQRSTSCKRVVVLGGSGRVGRSTAMALSEMSKSFKGTDGLDSIEIVISGRNKEKGEAVCKEVGESASFIPCDLNNPVQLRDLIRGCDLVIHTAGPFQRAEECSVLAAAIETKTPYIDVCDDCDYSKMAKKYHSKAIENNVPCITTTGIYPGISNLMAAEMLRLSKVNEDSISPRSLRFSYYTAGTGGAGPTILSTSFLLLGEDVTVYKDDKELKLKPYSARRVVDFGKGIGRRSVYLLNLPEVDSCKNYFAIPSVSARFGTAPEVWNWGMVAMANFVPQTILKNRQNVETIVKVLDPFVRAFDSISGERMSMRVDLEFDDGKKAVGIYSHKSLSKCVGQATASFAISMLKKDAISPGVWFPEEEEGISAEECNNILQRASTGTIRFDLNKAPWMIETEPKWIGFGLYF